MRVGITYDLRQDYLNAGCSAEEVAEFDEPETIDAIDDALARLGHRTESIGHVRSLTRRLVAGERWDLVFNIAEGLGGHAREAQVPAILDAYGIPYVFSDPLVCATTQHKAVAKRLLRDHGIPTPEFWLVESVAQVAHIDASFPLFAKPVAEGTSKGVGPDAKITSRAQLTGLVERLLVACGQPVLVERFLPGTELTVGVLGTGPQARAVAALEVKAEKGADQEIYTYLNKELCEQRVVYEIRSDALGKQACELGLRAWRALGCRDGGRVDVRQNVVGGLEVLEINPLPGLHPTHSDLPIMCSQVGMSYHDLIGAIVNSACSRLATASDRTDKEATVRTPAARARVACVS